MDFRVPATGAGLAFAYVLPFTANRALVEAVVLDHGQASAAKLDSILDVYLEEQFGGSEILALEEGVLPMTSRAFAHTVGGGISLGVGGGAARPSSGYAFANMMRAARQTAAALCAGRPLRQPGLAWKYRGLDTLFLRLLGRDPTAARRAFMAMFAGVEPDRLVRFLIERSSWQDDLALGFALPKAAFLKTAVSWPVAPARSGSVPSTEDLHLSQPNRSDQRHLPAGQFLSSHPAYPPTSTTPDERTTPCVEAATK